MLKKYLKYTFITLVLFGATFAALDKFAKHEYLNFLAKYYFDEKYYLAEYPEVKDSGMSAYDHYMQIGWKENKNPSAEFDTKLYRHLYFAFENKYNLSPLADYVYSKIKFKKRCINTKQLKKVTLLENPKYYLSVVALFRDEARFLKEWIEFYRLMGVEHFYLYNHLSQDNYMEVLQPYIDQGIVELRHLTNPFASQEDFVKTQSKIYTEIAQITKNISEWLLIVDVDEFLFPVQEYSLKSFLKKYDEYASLSINWVAFGTNNVQKIPGDKLMIESLTASQGKLDATTQVKTVIKPRYAKLPIRNPHFTILLEGYPRITANFEYFDSGKALSDSASIARINHYWTKDLDYFYKTKVNRVHVRWTDLNTEEEKNKKKQDLLDADKKLSSTPDDAILKYVPELRKRVFGK